MAKKAIIFTRVSSASERQDYARQVDDLKGYCHKNGFAVSEVFKEKISGGKSNQERPAIQSLIQKVKEQRIDIIVVSELSRLGRNAYQVKTLIEEFTALGVSIHIQNMGLKTLNENGRQDPYSNLLISIINEFSQLELTFLRDRIKSGLERAKKRGKKLGRPKNKVETSKDLLKKYKGMVRDLQDGISIRKVSSIHNVSTPTVQKVKKAIQSGK